jgi:hypothetical protein
MDTSEPSLNVKKDTGSERRAGKEKISFTQKSHNQKKPVKRIKTAAKSKISTSITHPGESQSSSPRYSFSTEIPERYNETYITAIPKDPDSLYVYWEFSDETIKVMNTMMDQIGSQVILRVKEPDTSDADDDMLSFHVEVNKQQEECFFKIPEQGKKYQVECGHLTETGEFVPIAQSDPVLIPFTQPETQLFDSFVNISENVLETKLDNNAPTYNYSQSALRKH